MRHKTEPTAGALWAVKCPDCHEAAHVIRQGAWWFCLDCDILWEVEA
jgi:ribosomal protein S27E